MRPHIYIVIGSVIAISILMLFIFGLHVGSEGLLRFAAYSPLLGAFIGSGLVLISIHIPLGQRENVEPWIKHEKLSWTLLGCSCLAWGIGECFWLYYVAHGERPFPSLADIGYASFLPLAFSGFLLQKFTDRNTNRQAFLLLDSLIATAALLSIAWFLLLGPLVYNPTHSLFSKYLALYYPLADIALLSCTIFLLLRERSSDYRSMARRISLVLIGIGLATYATSDFSHNELQNLYFSVETSWMALGWPIGMMTIGVAAYLRRFLPREATINVQEEQDTFYSRQLTFNYTQLLPYLLLIVLFIVLTINALSDTKLQESIRPVLIASACVVTGLVIIRQIITALDNIRLMKEQVTTLKQLAQVYQQMERRQTDLEAGVSYLKEIQTRLANGDVRARAQILNGDLWPLARGLNLMADRMMRSEQRQRYAQNLIKAISDLNIALERRRRRMPFVLPTSCIDAPLELNHLLQIIGLKDYPKLPPGPPPLPTPRKTPTHPHRILLLARNKGNQENQGNQCNVWSD
jgi:hypothetical protein